MPRQGARDAQGEERADAAVTRLGARGVWPAAARSLAALALFAALPYALPFEAARRFRVLHPLSEEQSLLHAKAPAPSASVGETPLTFQTDDRESERDEEPAIVPPAAAEILPPAGKPPRSIEDARENQSAGERRALDAFYAALERVDKREPDALARISYYGDSIVASDFVTSTLRRKLQKRFGDGGHGFMLLANPWMGYAHRDVVRVAGKDWKVSRVTGPFAKDGLYGLGGVSYRSEGGGLLSRFGTVTKGEYGRRVSRFVVDYLEHPNGGVLEVRIDGESQQPIDTRSDVVRSAIKVFDVPDGPHDLELRTRNAGVRAFGVWMERDGPGVVVDALGIQGCRIRFLDKMDDAHWAEQLRLRAPSLVVFQYGMNESEDGELFPLDEYESTMRAVLEQVRTALPDSSCLLVGPMDRADKRNGVYSSRRVVPKLSAIQRKVALETGCGYWDTLAAMGGFGSMGNWAQRGLAGADLAHPSSVGAEVLGGWIYEAILEGYAAYRARKAGQTPAPPQ